jgi:hypothetical protein
MGTLLGEPGGGGLLCWDPVGYERKALETGISLHGGYRKVGSSTGNFDCWLKGALEVGVLSLWELCEGNLEGELPC